MRLLIYPFLVAAVLAQVPENATFRVGTQEALVHTAVFDKKGNFQRDLTRDDFHLFEDGKQQKVTSLSLADGSGRSPHFIALVFQSAARGALPMLRAATDPADPASARARDSPLRSCFTAREAMIRFAGDRSTP